MSQELCLPWNQLDNEENLPRQLRTLRRWPTGVTSGPGLRTVAGKLRHHFGDAQGLLRPTLWLVFGTKDSKRTAWHLDVCTAYIPRETQDHHLGQPLDVRLQQNSRRHLSKKRCIHGNDTTARPAIESRGQKSPTASVFEVRCVTGSILAANSGWRPLHRSEQGSKVLQCISR